MAEDRIDPLIMAVVLKLPKEPRYPQAPFPPGHKMKFSDRDQWLKLLNAALDIVYRGDE